MMLSQPDPVTSANQFIGVLSPFYVVAQYNTNNWNNIRLDLWIWKGDYTSATSSDPNFVFKKERIDNDNIELNIANYVADTIDPVFNPFNATGNNSDNSFFYYELRYFQDNTLVHTTQSNLLVGCLGWRYDYQFFNLTQNVGGEYFPDGKANSEFGYFNLNSKLNYFKYPQQALVNNDRVWYTNAEFPLTNSNNATLYVGTADELESVCLPQNYSIGFINKSGNWDLFPITGKVSISTSKESTTYNRGFRQKTDLTQRYQNSVMEIASFNKVTYTVNTGRISPQLSNYLESILYSPRIFIVDYDTNLAFPVKLSDTNYTRKNKINDRNNINHTLVFEGNNSKKLLW